MEWTNSCLSECYSCRVKVLVHEQQQFQNQGVDDVVFQLMCQNSRLQHEFPGKFVKRDILERDFRPRCIHVTQP